MAEPPLSLVERERFSEEGIDFPNPNLPYSVLSEIYPDVLILSHDLRQSIQDAQFQQSMSERFIYHVMEQGRRKWSRPWLREPDRDGISVFNKHANLIEVATKFQSQAEGLLASYMQSNQRARYPAFTKTYDSIRQVTSLSYRAMPNPFGISMEFHENRFLIFFVLFSLEVGVMGGGTLPDRMNNALTHHAAQVAEFLEELGKYTVSVRQEWAEKENTTR